MLTTVKIVVCADPHIGSHNACAVPTERPGINSRAAAALATLNRAVQFMERHADALVVAGDIMDVSAPSPQLLTATRNALRESCSLPTYLLVGNHDQESSRPGDHALGPLDGIEAHVVDTPRTVRVGPISLRFAPFRRMAAKDYLPESLRGDDSDPCPTVGVIHAGIEDEDTAPQMRGHHDSIPLGRLLRIAQECGLAAIVAGNWHNHRIWQTPDCAVVQCGALCPTGWDNPGTTDYGKVTLLTFKVGTGGYFLGPEIEVHEIPGPRFVSFPYANMADAIAAPPEHYVAITGVPKDVRAATQTAMETSRPGKWKIALEVVDTPQAAQHAAMVVRAEASREGAVRAFVGAMPLTDGVDRSRVEVLSLGYLSRS